MALFLHRPTRALAIIPVVLLLYLILQHLSWLPSASIPTYSSFGGSKQDDPPSISLEDLFDNDDIPAVTEELAPATKEFGAEMHKFQDADDFLPHFKAVTSMFGMTMEQAKSGCNWPNPENVNFQYTGDDWTINDRTDLELETRRRQWHDFVDNGLLPWSQYKNRFDGRGIVVVAGHEKSMKRVRVLIRDLKKLGSQMPIELHYFGDELTQANKDNVLSMWPNTYFNDLSAPTNIVKTVYGIANYQLKTAAMMNSRFAEPLLLDSDNIPTMDPVLLYESELYKEYGTLFWPDIARTRPNNPMWAITNTKCRMDEYEQESGQMIVDKRRYFYHLQLASWFNNDPDQREYYSKFLLGDKDMFRFTWHALKTKYGLPAKWLTSVGTVSGSEDFYCGHTFAQHHPNGSVAFLHGGLLKTMAKEVMKWHRESRGGIFQVYKRSDFDEQHIMNVNVGIKWDPAEYLPNKPAEMEVASCTDMYDIKARPLDEIVPGFEKTFEEIGGYWALDD